MVPWIMTTDWYSANDDTATRPGAHIGTGTGDVDVLCCFTVTYSVADGAVVGSVNFEDAYESAERNRHIREGRMFLFSKLGAVVGDEVKYWPHAAALLPRGLAKSLPVVGYPSGCMSQHRGRSWDRRSRRGIK